MRRFPLLLLLSALTLTACAAPSAAEIQSAPLPPTARTVLPDKRTRSPTTALASTTATVLLAR